MAHNEMTEAADLNSVLSRRFGVQQAPSPNMATEFFPMVMLESKEPEWGFLGGTRRYGAFRSQAAVAAQLGKISLTNPVGSGVLIVIEHAFIECDDETLTSGWGGTGVAAAFVRGINFDSRLAGTGASTGNGVGQLGTDVGVGGLVLRTMFNSVEVDVHTAGGTVLGPGGQYVWQCQLVNTAIQGNIRWSERVAAEDELRGARTQL